MFIFILLSYGATKWGNREKNEVKNNLKVVKNSNQKQTEKNTTNNNSKEVVKNKSKKNSLMKILANG